MPPMSASHSHSMIFGNSTTLPANGPGWAEATLSLALWIPVVSPVYMARWEYRLRAIFPEHAHRL
jgi:hypothetical protein